jgi:hypothetical protein
MGDPQYALLNAKRLCEMIIDVVVGAELSSRRATATARRISRRASSTAA